MSDQVVESEADALLTIGHGTASAEELAGLIASADIRALVDVRAIPKSLRHPQFAGEALADWVPKLSGSAYRWAPDLGGVRKRNPASVNVALRHPAFRAFADYMETYEFASALDELLEGVRAERTAVMCSESLWWRCHRRLISDAALLTRGVAVMHLMHDGKMRPHVPTEGVRVSPTGRLRYDAAAPAAS